MLTVSFTQSGSSVKKWIPRTSTATACVTLGDLHLSALALSLHAILKAGCAFSYTRGAKVCHISGSSSGPWTWASLYSEEACRSQRYSGIFFLAGATWANCCSWCKIYSGAGMAGLAVIRGTSCLCKLWWPNVMWSAISRGQSDITTGQVWYREYLSHLISGASG